MALQFDDDDDGDDDDDHGYDYIIELRPVTL